MQPFFVNLALELCRIPSISGDENGVMAFLLDALAKLGFMSEKIPVTTPSSERFNVFAYLKPHRQYSVIFCTHLDTVAPFIAPSLDEKAGLLFGRGSCDAKGIAAAMIETVLREKARGFDDIALLFTVGEEEASDGAKACLPHLALRARAVVVGEPTELRAASAQKGSLVFDLVACGEEAHSSMPEGKISAIHQLVRTMDRLLSIPWPRTTAFGETLINFGKITGGLTRNIVASTACAQGIMRTSIKVDKLLPLIKENLLEGVSLEILSSTEPFEYFVPENFPHFLAGFGSDAPYLQEIGQPILFGPGSLNFAHRPDEQVNIRDLERGVEAYQQIAKQIRSKSNSKF